MRRSATRTADGEKTPPEPLERTSCAAAAPARRPKTTVSRSELPPRRFAPCTETHAHSPAAYSPGTVAVLSRSTCPVTVVGMPPIR